LRNKQILNTLKPKFNAIEKLCENINSTGLYPFSPDPDPTIFNARQFPRSSGYPEDAATGIAAAALSFGLLDWEIIDTGVPLSILQGEAMGCPSKMDISFSTSASSGKVDGCWIQGICESF